MATSTIPVCPFWCVNAGNPVSHYAGYDDGDENLMLEIHSEPESRTCSRHWLIFCLPTTPDEAVAAALDGDTEWLQNELARPDSTVSFDAEADAILLWSRCDSRTVTAFIPLASEVARQLEADALDR